MGNPKTVDSEDFDVAFQDALRNLINSDRSSDDLSSFLLIQGRGRVAFMIGRTAIIRGDVAPPKFAVAMLRVAIDPDGGSPTTDSFNQALSALQEL